MPADARTVFSNTLYILWWPTSKILGAIRYILSPFWTLIRFIFLPLTHLIQAILSVVLFPFRVDVLERIEVKAAYLLSIPASLDMHLAALMVIDRLSMFGWASPLW